MADTFLFDATQQLDRSKIDLNSLDIHSDKIYKMIDKKYRFHFNDENCRISKKVS